MDLKSTSQKILSLADIQIDGPHAWDLKPKHEGVFRRVLAQGSIGLGETYMDGWWEAERLDEFFYRLLRAQIDRRIFRLSLLVPHLRARLVNLQSRTRAFQVSEAHYDLGNDFFAHMLDRRMVYTCAYWRGASDLDAAQEAKLDLVCRKIGLKPGQRVLDIGCGWGGFAKFAAERYGTQVVGITVSTEQAEFARAHCTGLPVEIRLIDYRAVNEPFDHIVSIGMFEAVGVKNYRAYFEMAHRCLADEGLFLLHTIGHNVAVLATDPWTHKYIFPNGEIPSLVQISRAIEGLFVVEDLHNFGADYDKTLMAWHANFERAWPNFQAQYGERFYRMWRYFLLACAGAFRARDLQLWQIVLSKTGVPGGYVRLCA